MDALTPPAETGPLSRGRRPVIAAMLISTFMSAAEVTVISTAMPTIVSRLGGFDLFTWAFGIYLLSQAVMTPIYGRLADLYGRRAVYLGSTGLFLIGSLLCGLSVNVPMLVAVQGLGGGGLIPLSTIIIGDISTPQQRPRTLGYVSGIWGIAAIVGPLLGSLCVGTLGWPFVFWINVPVGVVTSILVARHLKDPVRRGAQGNLDLLGAALLALGILAGMAVLIQWGELPPTWRTGLAALSFACIAAFAAREYRAREPLLSAGLLRRPTILAANLSGLLCGALLIESSAFLPAWIQGVAGSSAMAAGLVLGVMTVSWSACAIGLGRVLTRLPIRGTALGGGIALVAGSAGLLLLGNSGWTLLLASCVAMGVGLGTCSLVFTVAVQSGVTWSDRGRATSLFYFSRLVGQAVGAAAFGGVMNAGLAGHGPATQDLLRELMDPVRRAALPLADLATLAPALSTALHGVFAAAVAVSVLTVPIALLVPRSER